jgi:hypothetical protein
MGSQSILLEKNHFNEEGAQGKSLPDDVLKKIKVFFQMDLGHVRVHVGTFPLGFNALALASGSHIFFAPGQYDLTTWEGRRLLGHELTHLVQQKRWQLASNRPYETTLLFDLSLEAEADRNGEWIANNWDCIDKISPNKSECFSLAPTYLDGSLLFANSPYQSELLSLGNGVFQPHIYMLKEEFRGDDRSMNFSEKGKIILTRYRLLINLSTTFAKVLEYMETASWEEQYSVLVLLQEWIGSSMINLAGRITRPINSNLTALGRMAIGRNAEFRIYNNYQNLATALLGEVRSVDSIAQENLVARIVTKNEKVNEHLISISRRILEFCGKQDMEFKNKMMKNRGSYNSYYPHKLPYSLRDSRFLSVSKNVAAIYDFRDFFKKMGFQVKKPILWDDDPSGSSEIRKIDMRNNVGTVNELHPWVMEGRRLGYSMQAGPSYSVLGILDMAQSLGATQSELTALSYAIFAFWNYKYGKACTPIHRFYGVMTVAKNFGVEFRPSIGVLKNAVYCEIIDPNLWSYLSQGTEPKL